MKRNRKRRERNNKEKWGGAIRTKGRRKRREKLEGERRGKTTNKEKKEDIM